MKKFQIFLDMNDTLLDTTKYLVEWHKVAWPYDDPKNCGHRDNSEVLGLTWQQCWGNLPVEFWESIPKAPWADDVIKLCENEATGAVYLLTSPIPNGICAHGKTLWVNQHMPKYKNKLIIAHKKFAVVDQYSLLIDDSYLNEEKFEIAGKRDNFLLFPSYMNRCYTMMNDMYKDSELAKMMISNKIDELKNKINL